MACLQHWSVVDPHDTMQLRTGASSEIEAVLSVFVYRVYSQLLANWSRMCAGDAVVGRGVRERDMCTVLELTKDLCESPDPWEVAVGHKFRSYMGYLVGCIFEHGLTRRLAETRRLAAASIFWRHTGGRLDIDAFF